MPTPTSGALAWERVAPFLQPVPRYTSYPGVPHWQAGDASMIAATLTRAREQGPLSVYVHLPFCERMCLYCGCNVVATRDYDRVAAYLRALDTELTLARQALGVRPLAQLHLGGGTPTFLTPADLDTLLATTLAAFAPTADAELSVEIDPVVTSHEHLDVLRARGVDRLSIGVQDFADEVQAKIERFQSAEITQSAVRAARERGFSSINLDLMYGLPGQTVEHVLRSARACVELAADRVALFGYAHVPTHKPHQRKLEVHGMAGPSVRWEMAHAARDVFVAAGYVPVGFDHYAKPSDALASARKQGRLHRSFQGYTVGNSMDLLGLCASAISDMQGVSWQNAHRVSDYAKTVHTLGGAAVRSCSRTPDDALRAHVIEKLMCELQLAWQPLSERFGVDAPKYFAGEIDALRPLEAAGLVELTEAGIRIPEVSRLLVRTVANHFDAYARANAFGSPAI